MYELLLLVSLSIRKVLLVFPEYLKFKIILMETIYWTMKNGQKIDVDTMDIQGEMAQNFIEQMLEEDYAPEDYNDLH